MNAPARNDKVYIHEFIDIVGPHRAEYMHHMTANYSPIGQQERGQQCFGVWGVLGSTGRWPAVVNIWQENGFRGLAASFAHETGHPGMQDPKLAAWWKRAAGFRSGGLDRLLIPAPGMPTIEALVSDGVRGEVYAHEITTVDVGAAPEYLARLWEHGACGAGPEGWRLVGAWRTALADDSECVALWAIPSWPGWAAAEAGPGGAPTRPPSIGIRWSRRILLVDAPLSPMRLGRQPSRADRTEPYQEE